jgi:hypothetical protein
MANCAHAHLGRAGEELANALEDRIAQRLGGKGDDQPLFCQARQVVDHPVGLVLQAEAWISSSTGEDRGAAGTLCAYDGECRQNCPVSHPAVKLLAQT